ncbi:MAG: sugar ABC transporter permease, partial [Klebsiella pneumoniae]|nr:sugar ABC transporter permease [Klebsiella pneumoniae]
MNENKLLGLAWISPYIIGLIVFTAFPFVSSFFLSFTEYDLMSPPVFNGIENYRYMLTEDSLFWKSMGVTFAYVFLTIPLKLAFALGIAFVLNFKLRGIGFFRTAYYIPSILGSSVAIAVLWRALFAIDGLQVVWHLRVGLEEEQLEVSRLVLELDLRPLLQDIGDGAAVSEQ